MHLQHNLNFGSVETARVCEIASVSAQEPPK